MVSRRPKTPAKGKKSTRAAKDSPLEHSQPNSGLDAPGIRLALGLLRLSTEGRPPEPDAIRVIHFALDHGIQILDTADVYSLGESDLHYGERLARQALNSWNGPREKVRIFTKVGLVRPKGRWMPNGRPEHLRKAVDRSLEALEVNQLFLLQLHAHDPRVPFEETLAALADLQRSGKVLHLGLCNASPGELRQAQRHFRVAAIQNELSVLNRKSATDGMLALTRHERIPFLAHRPLGGYAKVARLAKNKVLQPLAQRRGATPHQIALAALLAADTHIIPLVGATRVESIQSSLAALSIRLDDSDQTALSNLYSFAPAPAALATIAAPAAPSQLPSLNANQGPGEHSEVVLLMGIQGAGKSQLVTQYVENGYTRLNRDLHGGRLDDLVPLLIQQLGAGQKRVVLDNTYPTRLSRNPVIAAAHQHGIPVRCRFLNTPLTEAHFNIALRMVEKYGRPLGPDEMKSLTKVDPNLPPPAALARWVASFEPPCEDEGFSVVDTIPFVRRRDPSHTEKGLLLDVDGTLRKTRSGEIYPRHPDDVEVIPGRREILARWAAAGYRLFFVSNQSGVASGQVAAAAAEAAFLRTAELLQLPITEVAYCPHPAFPVGCYCRKPMPGLGVYLMQRHRLAIEHLIVVGDMRSDAEFAKNLGARYFEAANFFALNGPKPE